MAREQPGDQADVLRLHLGLVALDVDDDLRGRVAATSAMRSVPDWWSVRVSRAATPVPRTAATSASSSAHTVTAAAPKAFAAWRAAVAISGSPCSASRSFSGRRVEARRAGMRTATAAGMVGCKRATLGHGWGSQ